MLTRKLGVIALAVGMTAGASASAQKLGELGVYWDRAGWLAQPVAQQQGQWLLDNLKTLKGKNYGEKDIATWVEKNTGDGDVDVLLTWGDFPTTLYAAGNGEANGSLVEDFIYDGNMVWNTADYIFYVVNGAGTNGDTGLKNITNSTFDLWTDNNAIKPTADGKKYVPSLRNFMSHRSWKTAQVEADPNWEFAAIFGEGPLGVDPAVIREKKAGGYVGFFYQFPDDNLNRGEVAADIFNNWLPTVVKTNVDAKGKTAATWGEMKANR